MIPWKMRKPPRVKYREKQPKKSKLTQGAFSLPLRSSLPAFTFLDFCGGSIDFSLRAWRVNRTGRAVPVDRKTQNGEVEVLPRSSCSFSSHLAKDSFIGMHICHCSEEGMPLPAGCRVVVGDILTFQTIVCELGGFTVSQPFTPTLPIKK